MAGLNPMTSAFYTKAPVLDPMASAFHSNAPILDPLASSFVSSTLVTFKRVEKTTLDPRTSKFVLPPFPIGYDPLPSLLKSFIFKEPDLTLPSARDGRITSLKSMLQAPLAGQVGRWTKDTNFRHHKGCPPRDLVLQAMRSTISKMKKQDIKIFVPKFEVQSIDDSPSIWPLGTSPFDIKAYRIGVMENYGHGVDVNVTIFPTGSHPTGRTIHMYDSNEKKWIALYDWLYQFVAKQYSSLPRYSTQRAWWKWTGKCFPFLDLPRELRDKIYTHVFGHELYPQSTVSFSRSENAGARKKARLTVGVGYSRKVPEYHFQDWDCRVTESRNPIYEPDITLLQVNKQLNKEVSYYIWIRMRKCFVKASSFTACLDAQLGPAGPYHYSPQSPDLYGHLSKIELGLANLKFFHFFGADAGPTIHLDPAQSLGPRLQLIPGLRELHLRFRSPDDGYEGSPWGAFPQLRNLGRYGGERYVCCQRVVIDWICTFAHPFVAKRNFAVKLTGAVKKDTKKKWEAIFKGDLAHDHDAALTAILNTPEAFLPPICSCRQTCAFKKAIRQVTPKWFDYSETFDPED